MHSHKLAKARNNNRKSETALKMSVLRSSRSRAFMAVLGGVLTLLLAVDPFGMSPLVPQLEADEPGTAALSRSERVAQVTDSLDIGEAISSTAPMTGTWPVPPAPLMIPVPAPQLPIEDEQIVTFVDETLPEPEPDAEPEDEPVTSARKSADVELGGMDVTVAPTDDDSGLEAVRLRVSGETETTAAGIEGVRLEIVDASPTPADEDATVDLTVSYEDFAGTVGGDWSTRLRLSWIPDCTATTEDCSPVPLDSVNDPETQTVSAQVPVVASASASGRASAAGSPTSGGKVALTASASGSGGTWAATSLTPAATWGGGGSTGAFSWSLPITVPPVAGGPSPELALSYSSAGSDGKVPSTNNQSGPIGEGFDITSGYIERSYIPCSEDEEGAANNKDRVSGDLCWGPKNATMMFNGSGVELVQGANGNWRAKNDDGARVERLQGAWNNGVRDEYWKVTTPDGIQYFFGRGQVSAESEELNSAWTVPVYGNHPDEPCYKTPETTGFAGSSCRQVWRWNLEYVLDPLGNTMTYHYAKEVNEYAYDPSHKTLTQADHKFDTISYVAGGRLTSIEYGTRTGETRPAPAKVTFVNGPRCITDITQRNSFCTSADTDLNHWPDTPTDQICESTDSCTNISPTFFNRYRLTEINTSTYSGSAYKPVDSWALEQDFVGMGAGISLSRANGVMLRTLSITHTGHGGTATDTDDITLPANNFDYTFLQNRVDSPTDHSPSMSRPRITNVRSEAGASISVSYKTGCSEWSNPGRSQTDLRDNTTLCYPVKWYPNAGGDAVTDFFHKYVIDTLVEAGSPQESGSGSLNTVTAFEYTGGAAWTKPTGAMVKPNEVTFSDFRGFPQVTTTKGVGDERISTRTWYYRGLTGLGTITVGTSPNSVTVHDHPRLQGQVLATAEFLSDHKSPAKETVLSMTVNEHAAPILVAEDGADVDRLRAYRLSSSTSHGFSFRADKTLQHHTKMTSTYNAYSQITEISDVGDVATDSDDLCTTITYAHPTHNVLAEKYFVSLPEKTQIVAKTCGLTAQLPADLVSSNIASYDNDGLTTRTERIDPEDGVGYVLDQEVVEHDEHGRPLQVKDSAGQISTIAYTPSAGGLLASMTSTTLDPDGTGALVGFASTTFFNPLTGLVTSTEDLNHKVTSGTYDALGRLLTATFPQHQSTSPGAKPSVEYAYALTAEGRNSVLTKTLGADGTTQHRSVTQYDGLLRPFQTQTEGVDAGANHNATTEARGRMISHTYYNSTGNVSKETGQWWAQGTPATAAVVPIAVPPSLTTYKYDSAGRTTDQILWVGTDSNPDNEKWRTITGYDGATTTQVPPMGGTPQSTVTDARGRNVELREYLRDPDTHAAADTVAEVLALTSQSTTYTYDPAGQRTQMRDTSNHVWSYTYDFGGRQTAADDPDAGHSTTTYDSSDRVVTTTSGAGEKLFYQYDALGRTIGLYDDNATGNKRASWTYDTAKFDGAGATNALGQLKSSTRYVDSETTGVPDYEYTTEVTSYDSAYRPLGSKVTLPSIAKFAALSTKSFTTNYSYTADGQVASIALPAVVSTGNVTQLGSERVTTRYDSASIPSWMSGGFGWGTYVAESRFAADGRPLLADLGNTYGAIQSYSYEDGTKRLEGIALNRERFSGTDVNLKYTYDDAGNVTSAKDRPTSAAFAGAANQDNQCFSYDGLRRLESAWTAGDANCGTPKGSGTTSNVSGVAPYWTDYNYDPLGNRTTMTEHAVTTGQNAMTTTYTHGTGTDGPHQLSSMSKNTAGSTTGTATTFSYNNAGNRVSKTSGGVATAYDWDAEGELASVDGAENLYDANGDRLIRTDFNGTTIYLPGGQEVHISDSTVTASRYYSFAGSTVATRTGSGMGAVSSLVSDHHGSAIASISNTLWLATSVTRIFADPFGAVRGNSDAGVPGDHRFLNAVVDSGTNLTLLGARFYDDAVGIFISVDPKLGSGVPAQFNAYVYSGNNPMTWSDPTGLSWNSFWGGVSSFVNTYQAEIVGGVAGMAVFAACTAASGGTLVIACGMAGGAVSGAVTNLWKVNVSKTEEFSWKALAFDTTIGAAFGGLTAGAGQVLGAVVKSAMASPAGIAVKSAMSSAAKAVASKIGPALSGAGQKISQLVKPPTRGSPGNQYAEKTLPGGRPDGETVFAGHGEYRLGTGDTVVPEGTTVNFYSEMGRTLTQPKGLLIEQGGGPAPVSYGPGSVIPNYHLKAPDRLTVMSGSRTVEDATPLSDLLKPNMGTCHWAACTSIGS